jgi:hypothetical protein
MPTDGAENPKIQWDEARIALGRVGRLMLNNPHDTKEAMKEKLHALTNYDLIPDEVRQAIEDLDPIERQLLNKIFKTLADNHFYLEDSRGGLEGGY